MTELFQNQVALDTHGWIPTTDKMETNLPGVYAAGDVRDKYLRQICTGVADGAIAATAAERYIEEMEDFKREVLESPKPVLLTFWNPEYQDGLNMLSAISAANQDGNFPCKVIELDVTRKQSLAMRYQVALSDQQPVVCLKLEHGSIVHRLDLSADLRRQL